MATWATFVPCFLWVFTGAPWVERLLHQPRLSGAMSGIGAAVVGAVLNLSVWFGLHVLFRRLETVHAGPVRLLRPDPASLDIVALIFGSSQISVKAEG